MPLQRGIKSIIDPFEYSFAELWYRFLKSAVMGGIALPPLVPPYASAHGFSRVRQSAPSLPLDWGTT